ncbi:MAG: pyridoxamine 5'-phosphate oxidase family protein [Phycisphaerales bacterium]|nr:pyridoxamine 5'-phosphate oxidase family protein [Phycisphaerales bacterium]
MIESQRTLVLSTADPDPWCAPVYYLYDDRRFHFFSSPGSRHIGAARRARRCAAAIFRDSDDWRRIEGLQMEGRVEETPLGPRTSAAFARYVARFPTVRDLFAGDALDLDRFLARSRTRLYAFVPDRVHYLNNEAGLGKRSEIRLPGT